MQFPPPPPPTQYDLDRATAIRRMSQARFESTLQVHSVTNCISKCCEVSDFFTNDREKWPIKARLDKDMAEKKCVMNCRSKFDELYMLRLNDTAKKETAIAEAEAAMMMQRKMMGL